MNAEAAVVEAAPGSLEKEAIRRSTAPTTASAATPARGAGGGTDTFSVQRVIVSLALVIGVIFVLRWISRRMMGKSVGVRSTRAVQVLSRSMVSPRQQFLLVQVGRRLVVVADSGTQMNPVCEISDPDEVAALVTQVHEEKASSLTRNFSGFFGRAKENFDAPASTGRSEPGPEDDPADDTIREDISALSEKVKSLAKQFRGT